MEFVGCYFFLNTFGEKLFSLEGIFSEYNVLNLAGEMKVEIYIDINFKQYFSI